MEIDYQRLKFDYRRSPDQDARHPVRHRVIVIGAGPVGLALAIDLAQRGAPVTVLDDDDTLSSGSRAICFAKRTLEIFDRLGCGDRMVEKGVSWNTGKVFFRDRLVFSFDLMPETGHHRPAFINLQQYYVEGFLLERAKAIGTLEIRWKNKVTGLVSSPDGVDLTVSTPEGEYSLRADYVLACDGARSAVRGMLGEASSGQVFRDRFLIADVKMSADFPNERWFWFDPPFHPGQSVLLHHQPDDVWRIDFQLGWGADPVAERAPERVTPRIRALLGADVEFTYEWVSVYTFACTRMRRFRHGRVLFAGDAAHGMSPFGARGANGGVQDAENLAWKLKLVLDGKAPDALLDSYATEREYAADENILNSSRSTDFITPKSKVSRTFRDAVLLLARDCAFARRLVNSGRLSVPAVLTGSPLNTPDQDAFAGPMAPGAASTDAPIRISGADVWGADGWLLQELGGTFTGLGFSDGEAFSALRLAALRALQEWPVPVRPILIAAPGSTPKEIRGVRMIEDTAGLLAHRFDGKPGTFYLLRPDQHVAGRWRRFDPGLVRSAVARATCNLPAGNLPAGNLPAGNLAAGNL
ncbi:MAG: FAD-dependent oxidoreductase [Acetobacteraceae bacterium]